MQNLLNDLTLLLEQDSRLVAEGKLLKNKVVELALGLDAGLIKLLLKHDVIRKHFFVEVEDVLVFDKIKFQRFVSNKQFLPDSYTAFKNKIGLNEWEYVPVVEAARSRKINIEVAATYEKFLIENAGCIFRTARNNSLIKTGVRNKFSQIKSATGLDKITLNDEEVIFASEKVKLINDEMRAANTLGDIWLDIAINNLHNEGEVSFKNGKKPEKIIQRIISMTTTDGDLVLDFHLGSGTTAAVAHKMGRRYIGVEQMDYTETVTLERLKKVIAGEQGGISKSVNWQGGGSFVYCELSQANQLFIDQIQAAKSSEDLQEIWQAMLERAFLSYKLDPKIFDANKSEFASLAFADQQRFLVEVLDKNLLYVPYSEIDDASYAVSAEDKKLNRQFFNL